MVWLLLLSNPAQAAKELVWATDARLRVRPTARTGHLLGVHAFGEITCSR